ncbi:hypothetical protein N7475_007909 [Penicillium sp. IBT 31633x]|nr:hypothetical protein N7475_007909 [Penicillium sp. IBT 31633x]
MYVSVGFPLSTPRTFFNVSSQFLPHPSSAGVSAWPLVKDQITFVLKAMAMLYMFRVTIRWDRRKKPRPDEQHSQHLPERTTSVAYRRWRDNV